MIIKEYCKNNINVEEACLTYTDRFTLKLPDEIFQVFVSFCKLQGPKGSEMIRGHLHDNEQIYFKTLEYERRINSYLIGRYVAKKAISALIGENNLKEIIIQNGVFNQPVIVCRSNRNIQVSITHCDDFGAAIAFADILLIGVDIERADIKKRRTLESQLTEYEKGLASKVPHSYDCFLAMIWTIKESLSKVLKTGLTVPLSILEVKEVEVNNGYFTSMFSNFSQYRSISFIVEDYIISLTYPKCAEIIIDILRMKETLRNMLQQKCNMDS